MTAARVVAAANTATVSMICVVAFKKDSAAISVTVNALGAGIHIASGVIFKTAGIDVSSLDFLYG